MSGLDKIVEEIHRQAEAQANEILKQADEYCQAYMEDVQQKVEKEVADFEKKAQAQRNLYEEKTKSGGEFMERNSLLRARQQCINDVIRQAKEKIKNLPDEEYFNLLEKILRSNIQEGEGIMCLSEKDLNRIPADFESKINSIAKETGGNLTVSKEPAAIQDGFILVYGQIEENCTLKALFDANIDKLKDIANKELFGFGTDNEKHAETAVS